MKRVNILIRDAVKKSAPLCCLLLQSVWISCVQVDGGAVEMNWTMRSFSGADIEEECLDPGIGKVRLGWEQLETGEVGGVSFDCPKQRGVTRFVVPSGPVEFSSTLTCQDGSSAALDTYFAPPPTQREVVSGDIVTLNTLLFVVSDNTKSTELCAPAGCTCPR